MRGFFFPRACLAAAERGGEWRSRMRMKEAMRLAEWAWEAAIWFGGGAGRDYGGVLVEAGCRWVGK